MYDWSLRGGRNSISHASYRGRCVNWISHLDGSFKIFKYKVAIKLMVHFLNTKKRRKKTTIQEWLNHNDLVQVWSNDAGKSGTTLRSTIYESRQDTEPMVCVWVCLLRTKPNNSSKHVPSIIDLAVGRPAKYFVSFPLGWVSTYWPWPSLVDRLFDG